MIDLHCHSTSSDGVLSPAALVAAARNLRLKALALTDHDTLDGLAAFLEAAREVPTLTAVPGVELSCVTREGEKCHIVGLFLKPACAALQARLDELRRWRDERNLRILEKLAELGKPVTLEQALAQGEGRFVLGRPHIAGAMVKLRYVRSTDEAFEKYLKRDRPAYVPKKVLDASEAFRLLHGAGAVVVWAHPLAADKSQTRFNELLDEMCADGLDGIEAYYPDHTPHATRRVLDQAAARGLLVSGGCDYHGGDRHPGIHLAVGFGNGFHVPDQLLQPIQERAASIAAAL